LILKRIWQGWLISMVTTTSFWDQNGGEKIKRRKKPATFKIWFLHYTITTITQLLTCVSGKMLDIQHQYNNPSHEGGSHILGPTFMWRVVVQLLWWCCTRIKSRVSEPHPHVKGCCTAVVLLFFSRLKRN
jgi:hypothetical protein